MGHEYAQIKVGKLIVQMERARQLLSTWLVIAATVVDADADADAYASAGKPRWALSCPQ